MRLDIPLAVKSALGAERCRWRRRIQEVLDRQGIHTAAMLAREVGVTPTAVYRVLSGTLHTPRVLDKLREFGVPEEHLCDPRKAKEAA